MSKASQRRRVQAWWRYVRRYPQVYTDTMLEPIGYTRARYRLWGWGWSWAISGDVMPWRRRRRWVWRHRH